MILAIGSRSPDLCISNLTVGTTSLYSIFSSQKGLPLIRKWLENNTDLMLQSLDWPCSTNLWFEVNCFPLPLDPPQDNYILDSQQHTGTSSRCPGTQTVPLHYSQYNLVRPAQTWLSDTLAVWPGGLRQRHKQEKHLNELNKSCTKVF